MKKTKKIIALSFLFCLVFPLLVSATTTAITNPLEHQTFGKLIEAIINFISWIIIALAPLLIIFGAFYFMTAGGNPARIETGKNIILYTCLALLIILSAKALVAIIQNVLGVK